MNYRYGFIKELHQKYKVSPFIEAIFFEILNSLLVALQPYASKVIRLFGDVFSWLPLATVVDNAVLVCHGGISDRTDLSALNKLDRHKVSVWQLFH